MTKTEFDAVDWFTYKLEGTESQGEDKIHSYTNCIDKSGNKRGTMVVFEGPSADKLKDNMVRTTEFIKAARTKFLKELEHKANLPP